MLSHIRTSGRLDRLSRLGRLGRPDRQRSRNPATTIAGTTPAHRRLYTAPSSLLTALSPPSPIPSSADVPQASRFARKTAYVYDYPFKRMCAGLEESGLLLTAADLEEFRPKRGFRAPGLSSTYVQRANYKKRYEKLRNAVDLAFTVVQLRTVLRPVEDGGIGFDYLDKDIVEKTPIDVYRRLRTTNTRVSQLTKEDALALIMAKFFKLIHPDRAPMRIEDGAIVAKAYPLTTKLVRIMNLGDFHFLDTVQSHALVKISFRESGHKDMPITMLVEGRQPYQDIFEFEFETLFERLHVKDHYVGTEIPLEILDTISQLTRTHIDSSDSAGYLELTSVHGESFTMASALLNDAVYRERRGKNKHNWFVETQSVTPELPVSTLETSLAPYVMCPVVASSSTDWTIGATPEYVRVITRTSEKAGKNDTLSLRDLKFGSVSDIPGVLQGLVDSLKFEPGAPRLTCTFGHSVWPLYASQLQGTDLDRVLAGSFDASDLVEFERKHNVSSIFLPGAPAGLAGDIIRNVDMSPTRPRHLNTSLLDENPFIALLESHKKDLQEREKKAKTDAENGVARKAFSPPGPVSSPAEESRGANHPSDSGKVDAEQSGDVSADAVQTEAVDRPDTSLFSGDGIEVAELEAAAVEDEKAISGATSVDAIEESVPTETGESANIAEVEVTEEPTEGAVVVEAIDNVVLEATAEGLAAESTEEEKPALGKDALTPSLHEATVDGMLTASAQEGDGVLPVSLREDGDALSGSLPSGGTQDNHAVLPVSFQDNSDIPEAELSTEPLAGQTESAAHSMEQSETAPHPAEQPGSRLQETESEGEAFDTSTRATNGQQTEGLHFESRLIFRATYFPASIGLLSPDPVTCDFRRKGTSFFDKKALDDAVLSSAKADPRSSLVLELAERSQKEEIDQEDNPDLNAEKESAFMELFGIETKPESGKASRKSHTANVYHRSVATAEVCVPDGENDVQVEFSKTLPIVSDAVLFDTLDQAWVPPTRVTHDGKEFILDRMEHVTETRLLESPDRLPYVVERWMAYNARLNDQSGDEKGSRHGLGVYLNILGPEDDFSDIGTSADALVAKTIEKARLTHTSDEATLKQFFSRI